MDRLLAFLAVQEPRLAALLRALWQHQQEELTDEQLESRVISGGPGYEIAERVPSHDSMAPTLDESWRTAVVGAEHPLPAYLDAIEAAGVAVGTDRTWRVDLRPRSSPGPTPAPPSSHAT